MGDKKPPSARISAGKVVAIVAATIVGEVVLVLLIGIFAASNGSYDGHGKEKSYIAAMKSDLRNLVVAQDMYFAENHAFATPTDSGLFLKSGREVWKPSRGVRLVAGGTGATTNGWNAQVAHSGVNQTCSMFVGAKETGAFMGSGQQEGEPTCW